ncbi:ANTAR domain-containing protein [Streptomyces sp. NPDC102467]|uniref:ANTAR domain-containing protein n=1 Tax=Streptomyces sp. NPDC102467 TaxID=3366179 RepID=UPI00382664BE
MPESAQSGTGAATTCADPASSAGAHRLSGLTIFNHRDGDGMVVSVRGDLHLHDDQRLDSVLRPLLLASDGSIDLDLNRVEACGNSGVNILLSIDHSVVAGPHAEPTEDSDADLSREVAQLRRAMQSRGTIDMARGVLVAAFGVSPHDAWEVLVDVSQRTNIKLHRVAGHLVDSTTGTAPLPKAVQAQLSVVMARFADRADQEDPADDPVDPVDPAVEPVGAIGEPVDGHDWDWVHAGVPAPTDTLAAVPSPADRISEGE